MGDIYCWTFGDTPTDRKERERHVRLDKQPGLNPKTAELSQKIRLLIWIRAGGPYIDDISLQATAAWLRSVAADE